MIKLVIKHGDVPMYVFLKKEYIGIVQCGICDISYNNRDNCTVQSNHVLFVERGLIALSSHYDKGAEIVLIEYKLPYHNNVIFERIKSLPRSKVVIDEVSAEKYQILCDLVQSVEKNIPAHKMKKIYNIIFNASKEIADRMTLFRGIKAKYLMKINLITDELTCSTHKDMHPTEKQALTRFFNSFYGVSPYKWQLQLRLMYAKYIVITSSIKIDELSHKIGFNDTSNFISKYKKEYGTTPFQDIEKKRS